jgi:nucleolar protein 58
MLKLLNSWVSLHLSILIIGFRTGAADTDFTDLLPEDMSTALQSTAEVSMGTEISQSDLDNILLLVDQIISLSEYRTQLYNYLCSRMRALAPNLTTLVGELVGARLIAHAGNLINLAKQPASTIQILGAEKALFRALKTKHDTPKYGLIFHASLVGQASPKNKGKIARSLAAKSALSLRYDALVGLTTRSGDSANVEMAEVEIADDGPTVGIKYREKVEQRLRILENRVDGGAMRNERGQKKFEFKPYHPL